MSGTEEHDAGEAATGLPHVDAVVAAVEAVRDLPPADQVEAFTQAHEQLRRALDQR